MNHWFNQCENKLPSPPPRKHGCSKLLQVSSQTKIDHPSKSSSENITHLPQYIGRNFIASQTAANNRNRSYIVPVNLSSKRDVEVKNVLPNVTKAAATFISSVVVQNSADPEKSCVNFGTATHRSKKRHTPISFKESVFPSVSKNLGMSFDTARVTNKPSTPSDYKNSSLLCSNLNSVECSYKNSCIFTSPSVTVAPSLCKSDSKEFSAGSCSHNTPLSSVITSQKLPDCAHMAVKSFIDTAPIYQSNLISKSTDVKAVAPVSTYSLFITPRVVHNIITCDENTKNDLDLFSGSNCNIEINENFIRNSNSNSQISNIFNKSRDNSYTNLTSNQSSEIDAVVSRRPPISKEIGIGHQPSNNRHSFGTTKFPLDIICQGRVLEVKRKAIPIRNFISDGKCHTLRRPRPSSVGQAQTNSHSTYYPTTRSKSTGRMEMTWRKALTHSSNTSVDEDTSENSLAMEEKNMPTKIMPRFGGLAKSKTCSSSLDKQIRTNNECTDRRHSEFSGGSNMVNDEFVNSFGTKRDFISADTNVYDSVNYDKIDNYDKKPDSKTTTSDKEISILSKKECDSLMTNSLGFDHNGNGDKGFCENKFKVGNMNMSSLENFVENLIYSILNDDLYSEVKCINAITKPMVSFIGSSNETNCYIQKNIDDTDILRKNERNNNTEEFEFLQSVSMNNDEVIEQDGRAIQQQQQQQQQDGSQRCAKQSFTPVSLNDAMMVTHQADVSEKCVMSGESVCNQAIPEINVSDKDLSYSESNWSKSFGLDLIQIKQDCMKMNSQEMEEYQTEANKMDIVSEIEKGDSTNGEIESCNNNLYIGKVKSYPISEFADNSDSKNETTIYNVHSYHPIIASLSFNITPDFLSSNTSTKDTEILPLNKSDAIYHLPMEYQKAEFHLPLASDPNQVVPFTTSTRSTYVIHSPSTNSDGDSSQSSKQTHKDIVYDSISTPSSGFSRHSTPIRIRDNTIISPGESCGSEDDFDIMDVEMRRLEEKLKLFEDELGILSAKSTVEASGMDSSLQHDTLHKEINEKVQCSYSNRSNDVDVFRSFSLPKVYPPVSLLKTKHLSLTKQGNLLQEVCESEGDSNIESVETSEETRSSIGKLFLKHVGKLKKRRRRSLDIQKLLKNKVRSMHSITEVESQRSSMIPEADEETKAATQRRDELSRYNNSDFGFLWHDHDSDMTHLSFDALEQFSDDEIKNSLFFIFEEDEISERGEIDFNNAFEIDGFSASQNPNISADNSLASDFKTDFSKAVRHLESSFVDAGIGGDPIYEYISPVDELQMFSRGIELQDNDECNQSENFCILDTFVSKNKCDSNHMKQYDYDDSAHNNEGYCAFSSHNAKEVGNIESFRSPNIPNDLSPIIKNTYKFYNEKEADCSDNFKLEDENLNIHNMSKVETSNEIKNSSKLSPCPPRRSSSRHRFDVNKNHHHNQIPNCSLGDKYLCNEMTCHKEESDYSIEPVKKISYKLPYSEEISKHQRETKECYDILGGDDDDDDSSDILEV